MKLTQATGLCDAVWRNFDCGNALLREFAPSEQGDRESCYLWSYFAATGMLYHAHKAGVPVLPLYRTLIDGFAYYKSKPLGDGLAKYHSERGNAPYEGHGSCFFDDNIWVARNFLFAYEVFGCSGYLDEARRIAAYTYTGWNEEIGGLVWNENGLTEHGTAQELERGLSANACCILVNAILFRLTGEQSYLIWARRFYDFCKTAQDPVTKIYYNGVHTLLQNGRRVPGEVNRDLYSYNPGSMVLADLAMYEVTGERSFYEDALAAAIAAHHAFLWQDAAAGLAYYHDFVWFLAILAEAYHALAAYEPIKVMPCMAVFENMLKHALSSGAARDGLLPHDYLTGWRTGSDNYDRMLLTHSGTAEIAMLLCMHPGYDRQTPYY